MNRAQKIAWWYLAFISIGLLASIVAVAVLYPRLGLPGALKGFGCIGLGGLGALSPAVLRKERAKAPLDERDRLFQHRAWFAGYCASYIFFVVVGMATWFMYGPNGTISVNVLPLTVIGGLMALTLAHSVAILNQYGWTRKGEES